MSFLDLSKYRKELIETADIICSFLNEEEKKALEIIRRGEKISFRDQIIMLFYKKFPKHPEEKIKELVKLEIKSFQPYFKLKDDDCGINKVLLNRLDNLIFESEKGYWKQLKEQIGESWVKSR